MHLIFDIYGKSLRNLLRLLKELYNQSSVCPHLRVLPEESNGNFKKFKF